MQTYLLHSSLILTLLSIFYWLFLRKETFFKANRWLLLSNIVLALAIPLLPKPAYMVQLKTDLIASFQPKEAVVKTDKSPAIIDTTAPLPIVSSIIEKKQGVSIYKRAQKPVPISIEMVIKWVYLIGCCIMLFRFSIQLFSVFRQIKNSEITKGVGYYLVTNNKDITPYSFWNYIIINPNKYNETSFIQILEHERIHILQRHTIDLVIAELFLIIQWFNPLAWWHRYLIGQNLEFLVDQTLLDNGENKKAYQYHLVQVAVPNSPLSISSNYNALQLKNRIKMMNLQRSSLAASWKYALLLPITFFLLVAFTVNSSTYNKEIQKASLDALYIIITEDAKIADIKANQEKLLAHGVNLIFEKLQYNEENKIEAIKAVLQVDKTFGIAKWDKEKEGFKSLVLYQDWQHRNLGTGFSEELFEVVENRSENSKVFLIGSNGDEELTLKKLKSTAKKAQQAIIEKRQKLQTNPDWQGEWFTETTNFSNCSTEMLEKLKMEFLNRDRTIYTFKVNGVDWDESALEIPANSIGAYIVTDEGHALLNEHGLPSREKRKVDKRAISIIRKAKNIPSEKVKEAALEEIYIILTEEASLDDVINAQKELTDMGIKLLINHVQYDKYNARIEKFSAQFKAQGSAHEVSWNKNSVGYNFAVFGVNNKTGATFGGIDENALKQINPYKPYSKLFSFGVGDTAASIKFLESQLKIKERLLLAKQQEIAKNPDWKGYPQNNSTTYVNISKILIDELKNRIQQEKPLTINYYVDNVEQGKEILDIPVKEIAEIIWREKSLKKHDKEGGNSEKIIEQLNILVNRKEKTKAIKNHQYYEECDCYIPKTFIPNGKNIFKIEGGNITESSSFQVYNRWGKKVFDATPFNNHWNGEDNYGTTLKEATYFFTFQTQEGEAVAQGYFIIIDKKHEDSTGFLHQPETVHYVVNLCATAKISTIRGFVKPELFMRGLANKKRFSSIHLDENPNQSLLILRKFNNLAEAENTVQLLNSLNDKPAGIQFLSINQHNYRQILRLKSLQEYQKFYQKEILK